MGGLEKIASLFSNNSTNDKALDELQSQFGEISAKFSALNESYNVLNKDNEAYKVKIDELEMTVERCNRENDKLKERLLDANTNTFNSATTTTQVEEVKKEAAEPETKKTKVSDTSNDNVEEINTKINSLENTLRLLKEENMKIANERDNAIVNCKQVTDDAIRSSALYISQQATLNWHIKEQASHATNLQQIQDRMTTAVEANKTERERMEKWRKDWEKS